MWRRGFRWAKRRWARCWEPWRLAASVRALVAQVAALRAQVTEETARVAALIAEETRWRESALEPLVTAARTTVPPVCLVCRISHEDDPRLCVECGEHTLRQELRAGGWHCAHPPKAAARAVLVAALLLLSVVPALAQTVIPLGAVTTVDTAGTEVKPGDALAQAIRVILASPAGGYTLMGAGFSRLTDGVHGPAAVKGPFEPATAADPALVVTVSPVTALNLGGLLLFQGSTTAGQAGVLEQGAVTTAAPTYTTGQTAPFSLTTAGSLRMECMAGCAAGATFADEAAFTVGTTSITIAGYIVDETTPDSAPENSAAAPRMSANRIPYSILRDAAGTERGANVNASNQLSVFGPLTDTELRATAVPVSGTVTVGTFPDNEPFNVAQFGGTAVATGTGLGGAGIPRVTVSSDSTLTVPGLLVTPGAASALQTGPLVQCAVSATTPIHPRGATEPLSCDPTGGVRVTATLAGPATVTAAPVARQPALVISQSPDSLGCAGRALEATTFTNISLTASTQLITGTAGQSIYLCHVNLVAAGTAVNVALVEGTGSVCATGIAGLFGGTTAATGWNFAANGGLVAGDGMHVIRRTATTGDNVCLLVSAAVQVSGLLVWVTF